MIVSSTFTEGPAQVDGRRYVTERHTASDGEVYTYEWLGLQAVEAVLNARVEKLNELLAERAAAQLLVSGTKLPLTKLQFREMFTSAERAGIDAFHAGLETNAQLSTEQKASVRTGMEDFKVAQNIVRPLLPPVLAMLGLYVALGLISSARRDAIVVASNG